MSDKPDRNEPRQASPFDGIPEEEIVAACQMGSCEAMDYLLDAYKNFVRSKARSYYLIGKRQIITAIKTATRQKHFPLNSYISLNKPVFDEESDRTLLDVIEGRVTNPEDLYINHENMGNIKAQLTKLLSGLELKALADFLDGKSYQEIAAHLGRHPKSIDNALQLVKRKLTRYMEENDYPLP